MTPKRVDIPADPHADPRDRDCLTRLPPLFEMEGETAGGLMPKGDIHLGVLPIGDLREDVLSESHG
jgi:hypothetical protein